MNDLGNVGETIEYSVKINAARSLRGATLIAHQVLLMHV